MTKYIFIILFVASSYILLVDAAPEQKWELLKRIVLTNNMCDTNNFIYKMSSILKYLLPEASPCDEFYTFSCGGFERSLTSTERNRKVVSVYDRLKQKNERFFLDLLSSIENINDPSYLRFAKRLFNQCLKHSSHREFRKLTEWVSSIDNFPLLRHREQLMPDLVLTEIIAVLTIYSMKSPFFSISIEPNLRNNSQLLFTISEGLPIFNKNSNPIMTEYMLNLYAEKMSFREMDKIINLAKDMKRFYSNDGPEQYENYTVMNLQTLFNSCSIVAWEKLFEDVFNFSEQTLPKNIVVSVVNPSKLFEICDFVAHKLQTDEGRREIILGAMWSFVVHVIPHLSRKERLMAVLSGIPVPDFPILKNEKQYCVHHLQTFLYFEFEKTYIEMYNSSANFTRVDSIFHNVKRSLMSMINSSEWIQQGDRAKVLKKIANLRAFIGYHRAAEKNNKIQDIYTRRLPYFQQAASLRLLQRIYELQILINDGTEEWMTPAFKLSTDYSAISNGIHVPLGILQPPVYDERQSDEILYGSLGVMFGHQMMHAFSQKGRQFDENGLQPQFISEHTLKAYRQKVECVKNQYRRSTSCEKNIILEKELEESVADIVGLQAAYKAYKTLPSNENPHPLGTLFDLTSDQLFFVAFGQLRCSKFAEEVHTPVIINEHHMAPHNREFGVLANNEAFQNAYNCTKNSSIFQVRKCTIW